MVINGERLMLMKLNILLGMIGISIDIVGAYFLAQGFIRKNVEDAYVETLMAFQNLTVAKSMMQQKAEAKIGLLILTIGFLTQLLSYNTSNINLVISFDGNIIGIIITTCYLSTGIGNILIYFLADRYISEFYKYKESRDSKK